jgi:allantoate deiminase
MAESRKFGSVESVNALAAEVVRCCRTVATCSERPGETTRTYLSAPMRDVHSRLTGWMARLGMVVHVDAAGNLRGLFRTGASANRRRLLIGSHLDTVPNAGAFDGVLGVVMGIALVEICRGAELAVDIEVIGFAEEEGVRFAEPFIGSRALAGTIDAALLDRRDPSGVSVRESIAAFGLDVAAIPAARIAPSAIGYVEFHIEQGPVLDRAGLPIGIVDAIAGQSRLTVTFTGHAAHAGTTPMHSRRDALAGAGEWIATVERQARGRDGLVATVGRVEVAPNASNVIPSRVAASLDVRHAVDAARAEAVEQMTAAARGVASSRGLALELRQSLDQPSTAMSPQLSELLERSVTDCGIAARRLASGAGHDAMILAKVVPAAMLFLRSPGGISHHPDESVSEDDVATALRVGARFVERAGQQP